MKRQTLTIKEITVLAKDIYKMILAGDCTCISAPGQFINIKIDGFYLRRPISIACYDEESLTIIFKVVGEGTKVLAAMEAGQELDVLMSLGNGFDVSKAGSKPLLIGGGIGVPPIFGLCKEMVAAGMKPQVVMGFNTAADLILVDDFKALGVEPVVTTADGSVGIKGFVTDAMKDMDFDYVLTCGPEPMLKAIYNVAPDGQFSFEARMACGFGACMGCTCETKYGYKRICKDGPILYKEEIKW